MICLGLFFCIGIFHPIVIKSEDYFSPRCWPLFLLLGLDFLWISMIVDHAILSVALGVLGSSRLWSILELKQQKRYVERGFMKNPRCIIDTEDN